MTRVLPRRLAAIVAAVVLAGGAVSACSDGQPDEPDAEQSQPATSEPTSTDVVESAEPQPYLPVPVGVELTPPGATLDVGAEAVVAWRPRLDVVGVLDVTVSRLERTTFEESFEGWQLDDATRSSSPYFVRATLTNAGETDLGGRDVPLYAVDANDTLIEASSFQTTFRPCPGNGVFPKRFGPDATTDVCLVYLVPQRGDLTAVSFRPDQQFDPITWTGPIKKVQRDGAKKPAKGPGTRRSGPSRG